MRPVLHGIGIQLSNRMIAPLLLEVKRQILPNAENSPLRMQRGIGRKQD